MIQPDSEFQPCAYVLKDYPVKGFYKIGSASYGFHARYSGRALDHAVFAIRTSNALRLEMELHRMFAHRRLGRRELFALTADDLTELAIFASQQPREIKSYRHCVGWFDGETFEYSQFLRKINAEIAMKSYSPDIYVLRWRFTQVITSFGIDDNCSHFELRNGTE